MLGGAPTSLVVTALGWETLARRLVPLSTAVTLQATVVVQGQSTGWDLMRLCLHHSMVQHQRFNHNHCVLFPASNFDAN